MIDAREVLDAIEALLADALAEPVRLGGTPEGNPNLYLAIEQPPGTTRSGTLGNPEDSSTVRFRLRAVARFVDVREAKRAAADLSHRAAVAVLDRTTPIEGTGWAVTGRAELADGGTDDEGPIANHVADFSFYVTKA